MRQAKQKLDFDFGDGNCPTEDRDCTHLQRITIRGSSSQIRQLDEQTLQSFFDYIGYNQGFRVLTHDMTTDSTPARRSSGTRSSTSSSRGRRRAT